MTDAGEGSGPGLLDWARTPQRKGASAIDHLDTTPPSATSRTPYKPKATPSPGTRRVKAPALKVGGYPKALQQGTADIGALLARRSSGQ